MTTPRTDELVAVVESAQRAAGVLAARHRGDKDDAASLMATFADSDELAGGSLLLAELALSLYAQSTHRTFEECVQELNSHVELAVRYRD